ncbi:MAG: excinuclease ABC subunit C [Micavibrio sp.]|nr:excinuclease ABC subunit C [Micavibrio sp.]|tara:strand:+ start:770 stop:1675 length:906 start_codon:yes stop_codon:yes gene_type:complete
MAALPYTIRIFVPDGDPKGLRIIDKMNWTGTGLVFPRDSLAQALVRSEFSKAGIYILAGLSEDEDDPRTVIYIGQTDDLKARLVMHGKEKDFWSWACVFISTNDDLNRAHITWIEHELVRLANKYEQAIVCNCNNPSEPTLTEAEKADTRSFLYEMLQIMPLVGLNAFEEPKVYNTKSSISDTVQKSVIDTIIVPAKEDGFNRVFLGKKEWYAVRIGGGVLNSIKYIAAYQTKPISAITHFAPVEKIISYGDTGKYKLIFSESATKIKPISYGDLPSGAMQGTRYTSFETLKSAIKISELF